MGLQGTAETQRTRWPRILVALSHCSPLPQLSKSLVSSPGLWSLFLSPSVTWQGQRSLIHKELSIVLISIIWKSMQPLRCFGSCACLSWKGHHPPPAPHACIFWPVPPNLSPAILSTHSFPLGPLPVTSTALLFSTLLFSSLTLCRTPSSPPKPAPLVVKTGL